MEMTQEERQFLWESVSKFIDKHSSSFSEFEVQRIRYIILKESFPRVYFYDVIREICDELGFIPDEDNMYLAFLKELEDNFDIKNSHIIEVGGGMIPCLGKRISLLQDKGSITVYDPKLLSEYEDMDNFKLIREDFTHKSKLGNTNLLIGLMPCKGAEALIDQAIKHRIDFIVWLCEGGAHGDYYDFYEDEEEWRYAVISSAVHGARHNGMGEVKKKYLSKFSDTYPIIYSKK